MFPTLFPVQVPGEERLVDGSLVKTSAFCKKAFGEKAECKAHYAQLAGKPVGYYECPFGFTSRSFKYEQQTLVVTGVVAFPRFGSTAERARAKAFPDNRTAREAIEASIKFLVDVARFRADAIVEASKVLPQAFHELRKLNGAVIQHAEREIRERGDSKSLLSIKSGAELMRNNFDILEALSNIEGIKALPNDSTINVFDLSYKMKRVFEERAAERGMAIQVNGVRAIVLGSQKSFPIVPAVLIENAIKYGERGSLIRADIEQKSRVAVLTVENRSTYPIDPATCFDRGVRFSRDVEGGGFGLFLAKEVVTRHKGIIRCEASAGVVRMIVELPLHTVIPMGQLNPLQGP